MADCKFCAGEWIRSDYVGEGIVPIPLMLGPGDMPRDGVHLKYGNCLYFDSSSHEYAEQAITIKYCPFCGAELKEEEENNG